MQIFTTSGERAAAFRMEGSKKLSAMLSAAVIAIAVNTFMLKIAPVIKIKAGAGGLFGLLKKHYGTGFTEAGLSGAWTALGLPQPGTLLFYILFHSFIGFMMSILYVYAIEKYLAGTGIRKGAVFSMLPWLFNSIVVLPMLGNGFAGSRVIGIVGITYFFIANGVFGILLGYLYERFSRFLVKN